MQAGDTTSDNWGAIAPFSFGRRGTAAECDARMNADRNQTAVAAFGAEGDFDPPATAAALSALNAPVTVIAGEVDVGLPLPVMRKLVDLFPEAVLSIQAGAGHFLWLDDPRTFVEAARWALSRC